MTQTIEDFTQALEMERLSPRTIQVYVETVTSFHKQYGPEFNQSSYDAWKAQSGKWAPATVIQRMTAFSKYAKFLKVSVDLGEQPRQHKKIPLVVTAAQRDQIVAEMPNQRHRVAVWLMSELGIRVSEACTLRWQDVDMSARTVTITRKGGDRQVLPILGDVLMSAFSRVDRVNEFVLGGISRAAVAMAVSRACKRCGVEAHPHAFRHGFSVSAAKKGVSIPAIQKMLGHSSPTTTNRYLAGLQMDADELREAFGSW